MGNDQTRALGEGQKAPFEGFLLPEYQFRKMNQDLIEKDLLEKQLALLSTPPEIKRSSFEMFLWGFLSGSLTVVLAEKLGGK